MDLKNIRKNIDEIDEEIVQLLCKRFAFCSEVANYKMQNNLAILDESREEKKLDDICKCAGTEFAPYISEVYKHIMDESKKYQKDTMGNLQSSGLNNAQLWITWTAIKSQLFTANP